MESSRSCSCPINIHFQSWKRLRYRVLPPSKKSMPSNGIDLWNRCLGFFKVLNSGSEVGTSILVINPSVKTKILTKNIGQQTIVKCWRYYTLESASINNDLCNLFQSWLIIRSNRMEVFLLSVPSYALDQRLFNYMLLTLPLRLGFRVMSAFPGCE